MITLERIRQSAEDLKGIARVTSLIESPALSTNGQVFLKTENLQVTGSFKLRGAYCRIKQLTPEERKKGVIACSAGNHAQGVALAATKEGISSMICLPEDSPIFKVEATKRYGAEVVRVKGVFDDAYNRAVELQKETGRIFIHPFNDESVICGQGTIGLEIMEQLPDVDVILVPIGGGGLISGIAFAAKSINPNVKVYGVEPDGAASMKNALEKGRPEKLEHMNTISDGIAVKQPGDITFAICQKYLDGIVTVSDDETASAMLELIEQQKLIVEGSGGVSVAAVLSKKLNLEGKKVVCVLSGGNIDVKILSRVINRGLTRAGRICTITLELADKPGYFSEMSKILGSMGANLHRIEQDFAAKDLPLTSCYCRLQVETRGHEHDREICEKLKQSGFNVVSCE